LHFRPESALFFYGEFVTHFQCEDVMKNKYAGFTLIELVVVIVILGILAAFALPRYAALESKARIAKLSGAMGAVKSAAALAHGACLATQTPAACTSAAFTLTMEGLGVTLINQYPTADAAGIVAAAGLTLSAAEGFDSTLGGPAAGDSITIKVLGNDPANCSFTYAAPAAANSAPVHGAAVTTGC
jgi:MSHA pilin protein MshA